MKKCTSVRVAMKSLSGGSCGFWQTRDMRRSKSWRRRRLGGGSKRQLTWRASVATSCSCSKPVEIWGDDSIPEGTHTISRQNQPQQLFISRTSINSGFTSSSTHWECWQRLHIDGKSAEVLLVSESNLPLFSERLARNPGTLVACFHCH